MITTNATRTRLSSSRRAVPVSPLVDTSHGGANRITSAATPAKAIRPKISSSSRPSRLLHRDERFMAGEELWLISGRTPAGASALAEPAKAPQNRSHPDLPRWLNRAVDLGTSEQSDYAELIEKLEAAQETDVVEQALAAAQQH